MIIIVLDLSWFTVAVHRQFLSTATTAAAAAAAVTFLLDPHDGVCQRAADNHQHADPPQGLLSFMVPQHSYDGLRDGLGVG